MKKLLLVPLALLFLSLSFAQNYYVDMSNPEDLDNPNGYYEYKIIKGDCLWFIADDFYNDPFQWTKIHDANPYIINPDWIYPNNWLVIPNIFTDKDGNLIMGSQEKTWAEEESTWGETSKTWGGAEQIDSDGDGIIDGVDLDGDGKIDESANIDTNGDGIVDGYDIDGDGEIDIMAEPTTMAESMEEETTEMKTTDTTTEAAASTSMKESKEQKTTKEKTCTESYCGKPGWKLGLHAGTPLASAPNDESLNLGVLLGTPLGFRVGPVSVGLGAGVLTYNFEDIYFGVGGLASLCINDLLKLDIPVMFQLHGLGFYIFGEDSGPGFGGLGSVTIPFGDSPLDLGIYAGIGKYYPGDNDYNWGNAGAILYYNF